MADVLPCPDGAGSINNEEVPGQQNPTPPLVVVEPCVGSWEISGETDICAINEQQIQDGYAAEILNINGAPLNIYKLLGVHEQGEGSLLSSGTLFASAPAPGFPLSNINNTGAWQSLQTSTAISGVAYVGIDFGINTIPGGATEYLPVKPNWKKVGAVVIKQMDTAINFARQVRVETTDGSVESSTPVLTGTGNGTITSIASGPRTEAATITATATSATSFTVTYTRNGTTIGLGIATVGSLFNSVYGSFLISAGSTPFISGDIFTFNFGYVWKRQGVYNLIQSGSAVTLNLQKEILVKAVRVIPSLYTGSGSWGIETFDVLDSPPTNINNIQDLFFNENRDRDYAKIPLPIKAQYQISSSITDLSKYGLSMLDQYSFVVSFSVMVALLGRPIVTGDIIEVIPEMQYDHNLKPIRKFLEVTDTGWAAEGYSPAWKPTLYRFAANQALPSQETRDIFGTINTQKYMVADSFFNDLAGGQQIDTTPLTNTEEIAKAAQKAVPETGSDDTVSVIGQPLPPTMPPVNAKGQPAAIPAGGAKQGPYQEDGIPPNGEPYGEGYDLPSIPGPADGDWFRLYYPESTSIPPRLYRFSMVKNKWIYMETDRRQSASSLKPSVRSILNSNTKQGLGKKLV
jgi:hypothetical protein